MPVHPYFPGSGGNGTGSGSVNSVNGEQGDVILTAQDLQAQPQSSILTGIASVTMPDNSLLMVDNSGSFVAAACMPAGVAWLSYTTVDQQKAHLAYSQVAETGSYDDLSNKPVLFSGNYGDLTGKPTLFDGTYASLTGKPTSFTPSTHTHVISDVTGLQSALDSKIGVGSSIPYSVLTGTPVIPAAQIQSDWNQANTASLDYIKNKPAIPAAQVQTDWNAVSGLGVLLNKPSSFTPSAHTQAWSTITATPTTVSGYGITDAVSQSSLSTSLAGYATTTSLTNGLSTKFNTPVGTPTQYLRGDGSLATFPAIPTVPTVVSAFTNDAGYLTSITSSQVSTALGYTPYNGTTNPNSYITQSGARTSVSLTTTGTTGAATYNSTTGVLNVPNYSAPVRTFTNPARTLNTAFQISSTQDAQVSYSVDITVAAVLIAGTAGRVYLEYANESGFTTGVTVVASSGQSTGGVLSITNLGTANLSGIIPAGKYVRLRTANVTGTPTFTYQSAQEVLLG